jgi:uncharacterized membrane protein
LEHFITKNLGRLMLVVVLGAMVALILVVSAYVCTFSGGPIAKQDVWGQFGDYIGGTLNPILSFLALLALLLTIVLQSYELRLTRQEMELSRVAQQKTEVALADQANTLREQLAEARRSANTEAFLRASFAFLLTKGSRLMNGPTKRRRLPKSHAKASILLA